jgi:glycosyltransferase involved in cell wall biosynthesis
MKLCIITCYNQPDYIRARTLRTAAALIDEVEVVTVKNRHTGLLRYLEVLWKVLKTRLIERPDVYLLTFRGYEMLLPIRLLSVGKSLIYDEFINPIEWVSYEHKKLGKNNPLTWGLWLYYHVLLSWTSTILADTNSHADLSAEMMKIKRSKFVVLPVGTDETTFTNKDKELKNDVFTVFYYGNMLPLHGLSYVIDAAVRMSNDKVSFVLVGGNAKVANDVACAVSNGANIEYQPWVVYEQLPQLMKRADLCLAGPFGDTFQAQYVITGKAYQYLAMGRPTVVGVNKESGVFTDKKDALLVPQADTDALVRTIRWAMKNKEKLADIGMSGRKLYQSQLSVERISEKLEPALRALVRD